MSDTPAKYPDLTAELRDRSLLGALKIFGPGAIIASVTIGNGETIFASRGGAIFGYTLMWCFVLGAAIKFFQVYSGARFITLTGRHPLESWAQLPGLRGWFVPVMTVLTLICMPLFLGGGLPRILGDFTNSIFGIVITPESAEVSAMAVYESKVRFDTFARIWGSLYILVAIGLTLYQTYGFLERVQTFVIGLLLFSMFVAVVASRPDLMALVQGIFIPTIPQYEPWIMETITLATRDPWVEVIVYLGVIGGGTVDYFGYLGTLREKGWGLLSRTFGSRDPIQGSVDGSPKNASLGRSWLRAPLIDVSISFAAVIAFTLFFATLGAAILHPEHVVPEASELVTKQQAFMVRESQHPSIQWLLGLLYKTGIFFAFFGDDVRWVRALFPFGLRVPHRRRPEVEDGAAARLPTLDLRRLRRHRVGSSMVELGSRRRGHARGDYFGDFHLRDVVPSRCSGAIGYTCQKVSEWVLFS